MPPRRLSRLPPDPTKGASQELPIGAAAALDQEEHERIDLVRARRSTAQHQPLDFSPIHGAVAGNHLFVLVEHVLEHLPFADRALNVAS